MKSNTAASNRELAQRIREGNQRRLEEQRQLQALRQAYEESQREAQRTGSGGGGPTAYLPLLLVFLLFASFPLSEQIVDWHLVLCFLALNVLCAVVVSEPSHWMNVLTVVLANLILVRLSPYLYDIPALLMRLQPVPTALYLLVNAVLTIVLYYGYVQRRLCFFGASAADTTIHAIDDKWVTWTPSTLSGGGTSPNGSGKRGSRQKLSMADAAKLQAFLRESERAWRVDVAASVLLLFNVGVLVYAGILPREAVAQAVRNVFRMVS